MIKLFQIKQNYKKGISAWIQYNAPPGKSVDEIKNIAIEEIRMDWQKQKNGPKLMTSPPVPPSPTAEVTQIDENGRKVKKGLVFKVRWR